MADEQKRASAFEWEHNFIRQMKARREGLKLSQSALAKRIAERGIPFHQPTVQRIEDGLRPVRLDEAHLIAAELQSTVSDMTVSFDDVLGEGVLSVDRVRRFAGVAAEGVADYLGDWDESWAYLVRSLQNAIEATGGEPTRATAWLGAWVIRARRLDDALASTVREAADVHDGETPDIVQYREGKFWSDEARIALDDTEYWEKLPEQERPEALARLGAVQLHDYLEPDRYEEHWGDEATAQRRAETEASIGLVDLDFDHNG